MHGIGNYIGSGIATDTYTRIDYKDTWGTLSMSDQAFPFLSIATIAGTICFHYQATSNDPTPLFYQTISDHQRSNRNFFCKITRENGSKYELTDQNEIAGYIAGTK